MYMQPITVETAMRAPHPAPLRVIAGTLFLMLALLCAIPYWIALSAWIGIAGLLKAVRGIAATAVGMILFAGDLMLGDRVVRPDWR